MTLAAVGPIVSAAARGVGYGVVTHFGGILLFEGTLHENRKDKPNANPLRSFNSIAISGVAGAAIALLSLAFGTLPMLGMALGGGLYFCLKGHSLASSDTEIGPKSALEGTVGTAIISFVAFAILVNIAPGLAI